MRRRWREGAVRSEVNPELSGPQNPGIRGIGFSADGWKDLEGVFTCRFVRDGSMGPFSPPPGFPHVPPRERW